MEHVALTPANDALKGRRASVQVDFYGADTDKDSSKSLVSFGGSADEDSKALDASKKHLKIRKGRRASII